MYIKGLAGQVWVGELLSPVTLLGVEDLAPHVQISVDSSAPYEGVGAIEDLGHGQYRYHLEVDDVTGDQVSVLMYADGIIPDRAMILPFEEAPGTLTVEQYPFGPVVLGVTNLTVDGTRGGFVGDMGGGQAFLSWDDADVVTPGLVNVGAQSWQGPKSVIPSVIALPDGIAPSPTFLIDDTAGFGQGTIEMSLDGWDRRDSSGAFVRTTLEIFGGPTYGGLLLRGYDALGGPLEGAYYVTDGFGTQQGGYTGSVSGLQFFGGISAGGTLAPTWSSITGKPTTLAGYGVASPLDVAEGGTGLAATGSSGNVLTSSGGVWVSAPPGVPVTGPVFLCGTTGGSPLVVRQTGGTPGTDEVDVYHDGTDGYVVPRSGMLRIPIGGAGTLEIRDQGGTTSLRGVGAPLDFVGVLAFSPGGSGGWYADAATGNIKPTYNVYDVSWGDCSVGRVSAGLLGVRDGSGSPARLTADAMTTPGTHTHTHGWGSGAVAPASQTVLALPLQAYGAGAINQVLGTPDAWITVDVAGVAMVVPAYVP